MIFWAYTQLHPQPSNLSGALKHLCLGGGDVLTRCMVEVEMVEVVEVVVEEEVEMC